MTMSEAIKLCEQMKACRRTNGSLLEMMMPNGKKLRDCTGVEIGKFGEELEKYGQI